MKRAAKSALIGKWRITKMALWDNDYLDMVEPAYIQFKASGRGEFKFGCVVGDLDCTLFADAVDFTWQGSDEMDPSSEMDGPNSTMVDSHPSGLERWSKHAPCTTVARHLASHMARRRARSLRSYRPSVIVLCTIQCPQLLDG